MSHLTTNARRLRKSMTDAELLLWRQLRAQQLPDAKFRRHHPLGPYIVDFVCLSSKLVIELDGSQHFDSTEDRVRDAWLVCHGYRVLRFWNNEVLGNLAGVLTRIAIELCPSPLPSRPVPSPLRGEG